MGMAQIGFARYALSAMCTVNVRLDNVIKRYAAAEEGQKSHKVSGVVTAVRNHANQQRSMVNTRMG